MPIGLLYAAASLLHFSHNAEFLAVYAAFGLDGLAHYTLAPMSAHTGMMNFSILFEVAMALLLLCAIGAHLRKSRDSLT